MQTKLLKNLTFCVKSEYGVLFFLLSKYLIRGNGKNLGKVHLIFVVTGLQQLQSQLKMAAFRDNMMVAPVIQNGKYWETTKRSLKI